MNIFMEPFDLSPAQSETMQKDLAAGKARPKIPIKELPEGVTKTVIFDNNDVPEYLEKLKKFEEESKKSKFVVK